MALQAGYSEAEAWETTPARIWDLFLMKREYDDEQHRLKRVCGSDSDGD